jgi:hypothetical protein
MNAGQFTGGTMLRTTLATVLCLGGLSIAAAPATQPAPQTAPKPANTASKYPVIVHVVSRDKTITISAGPKGPVYSAAMNDGGKILIADASGEQFAKEQPELYRMIRGTIAVKTDMSDAVPGANDSADASATIEASVDSR